MVTSLRLICNVTSLHSTLYRTTSFQMGKIFGVSLSSSVVILKENSIFQILNVSPLQISFQLNHRDNCLCTIYKNSMRMNFFANKNSNTKTEQQSMISTLDRYFLLITNRHFCDHDIQKWNRLIHPETCHGMIYCSRN